MSRACLTRFDCESAYFALWKPDKEGDLGDAGEGHDTNNDIKNAAWTGTHAANSWIFGGAERDRTAGLLVANEALSQLSYSPTTFLVYQRIRKGERATRERLFRGKGVLDRRTALPETN